MRQRHMIEPTEPGATDDRGDNAIADVEGGRGGESAGVDEQRRAAREDDEARVALADIDEGDVQQAVAARRDETPRIDEDPESGSHRERNARASDRSAAAPPDPRQRQRAVVDEHDDRRRRRQAADQRGRESHEVGRPHQPGGTHMRNRSRDRSARPGDHR